MGTLEQIWGPNGVLGTQKLKKVPMGTGSQMGTHVGEVYMALIWDLHSLGRISMGFLSSYTAMRLVPGAAKVPQHVVEEANCVQNLGLGYIEVDQQTEGRLKILVLFNLGLAHVAAPLLVHRQVVQAKESFPLLKAGRQRCVPNLPASRQLSPLRQLEIKGDSDLKTSPTLAESSKKVAPVIILLDLFAWVASIRRSKTF